MRHNRCGLSNNSLSCLLTRMPTGTSFPAMGGWNGGLKPLGRLSRLVVTAGALFVLLSGLVLSALHHHSNNEAAGHCVICALAGVHASSPPRSPEVGTPQLQQARPAAVLAERPTAIVLPHTPARAPPTA